MKNTLVILISLFFSLQVMSQDAVQGFFDKYKNDENFTQVNISPKMFQMLSQMEVDTDAETDEDVMEMISSLKGLKILRTESNPMAYYKEFNSTFNQSTYEELMTVKDGDTNVTFLVKDSDGGNIVKELLLLVGGSTDFVLMRFEGDIPLDKVGKLATGLNISGAEHLDKLKK